LGRRRGTGAWEGDGETFSSYKHSTPNGVDYKNSQLCSCVAAKRKPSQAGAWEGEGERELGKEEGNGSLGRRRGTGAWEGEGENILHLTESL